MSSWKLHQQYIQWMLGPLESVVNCYLVPVGAGCLVQFTFEEHLKPPCHWHCLVSEPHEKWVSVRARIREVTGFVFAPSSKSLWFLLGYVLFLRAV